MTRTSRRSAGRPARRTLLLRLSSLTAAGCLLAACGTTVPIGSAVRTQGGLDPGTTGGAVPEASGAIGSTDSTTSGDASSRSGGAGTGTGATGQPEGGQSAGSTTAGAATPSPLVVGFLRARNQQALTSSFGVSADTTVTSDKVQQALVAWFNAHGGLRGHRLKAVFADVNATSTNYENDYQAACETLVRDNHVRVAVNTLAYFSPTFEACMTQARAVELRATSTFTGADSARQYPYLVGVTSLSVDRRLRELAERMSDSGYFTPKSRIGVLMSGCPHNLTAYDRSFVPALRARGITVMDKEVGGCTTGSQQAGRSAANASTYVLKFQSLKVDRVVIISDQEDAGLLLFANEAEAQGYRPGYAVTSIASPAFLAANLPEAQRKNLKGIGWLPFTDSDASKQPAYPPSMRRCTSILKHQGIVPSSILDLSTMAASCSAMFLLEQVADRPVLDGPRIAHALAGLGTRTGSLPSVLVGDIRLTAARRDAPFAVATLGYDAACSCIRYTEPPSPVRD